MAQKHKPATPIVLGIRTLITWYEFRHRHGQLCSTGKERLKWWKANARKFSSVKAAMLTWTDEQIRAFCNDRGLTIQGSREQYTLNLYVPNGCKTDELPRSIMPRIMALRADLERIPSSMRRNFAKLTDEQIVPKIWIASSREGE